MIGYAKLLTAALVLPVAVWVWRKKAPRSPKGLVVLAGAACLGFASLPALSGYRDLRHAQFLAAILAGPPEGLTDRDLGWDDGFPELRAASPDLPRLFAAPAAKWQAWEAMSDVDKNNLRCLDLRGFDPARFSKPLEVKRILTRTEDWEFPNAKVGAEPDSLGYSMVVKNVYGSKPDGKYYLFYAHHDVPSGIGCAVADNPGGPFRKLRELDPMLHDSEVLRPDSNPLKVFAGTETAHFSSPCVLWNPEEKKWFLYFHFYKNEFTDGRGHQKTALATCGDLASHRWTVLKGKDGGPLPVLPVTVERWMNSQSSYHAIQRLPNGLWLAFLRGTGGEYTPEGEWKQDVTKLGFAVSRDGRKWTLLPHQPAIAAGGPNGRRDGCYRPFFAVPLAPDKFAACWGESLYYDKFSTYVWGLTSDFQKFDRPDVPAFAWHGNDGPGCVWREGDTLWVYGGNAVSRFTLRKEPK